MKERLIEDIVNLEWEMFSQVNNLGGRAPCQEDENNFRIMREGQAETWSEQLLLSYYDDLQNAKTSGRNMATERYAYMMEHTYPDEYKAMARFLPTVDDEKMALIDEIVAIFLDWRVATSSRYPHLSIQGRAIFSYEDRPYQTSFETYLRSELKTYSPATINLYHALTLEHKDAEVSLEEKSLFNIVRKYGYETLEQADKQSEKALSGLLGNL